MAIVVAAVVAAPWYIAMEHAHPGYLHYYFVERHVQGYLTATQRHAGRPFWYYVPIVLGGALPWSLHLAGAIRSARAHRLRLVLWGWFALGLVFLSAGESKLVTYALPLFPSHRDCDRRVRARDEHAGSDGASVRGDALGPDRAARAAAGRRAGRAGSRFGPVPPSAWLPIVVFGVLTLDAGRRARRGHLVPWLAQASICSLIATMTLVPRAASWMTSKDLAAALNAGGALPSRVSVVDERIGSLVFYLDPALRAERDSRAARRSIVRRSDITRATRSGRRGAGGAERAARPVQPAVHAAAASRTRRPARSRCSAPANRCERATRSSGSTR